MKNVFIALGKAICYTLLFAAMQLIAGFIVALAMLIGYAAEQLTVNGGIDYNALIAVLYDGVTTNATLITLVSNICTVGVLFAFFALRKKNLLSEINASPIPALTYVPLSIMGMCFAVLITFALGILPISEEVWEEYNQSASMIDSAGLIPMLSTVIFAPTAEETVFRGLVYTRLKRAMPAWVAAILQAAVFGVLHGQIWVAYAFVMGLVLAAIVESTGSLFAGIAVHICFNLMGGYVMEHIFTESTAPYIVLASIILMVAATRSAVRIAKSGKNI